MTYSSAPFHVSFEISAQINLAAFFFIKKKVSAHTVQFKERIVAIGAYIIKKESIYINLTDDVIPLNVNLNYCQSTCTHAHPLFY